MGLKTDAEEVRDKAGRIVNIISFVQRTTIQPDDNPDLEMTITAAQKQQLQNKVLQLQTDIKAITGAW